MQYSIGTGIGKRRCVACIMDGKKRILEETAYDNTSKEACLFARKAELNYGGKNCQAVCESTGSMWPRTCEAFESAGGMNRALANLIECIGRKYRVGIY